MDQFISFLRKNTLLVLVVLIVVAIGVMLHKKQNMMSMVAPSMAPSFPGNMGMRDSAMGGVAYQEKMAADMAFPAPPVGEFAPQPNIGERMVIQNSYLSLLVEDVKKVREDILSYVQSVGGYMVSSDTTGGEESLSSTITVRVPQTQLDAVLSQFRSYAIQVVSEHLDGQDVTDQYVDIQKRIDILEQTMSQFEELRETAKEVSDLTNLTRELLNIQSQIDSYKGQQESLEKNSQFVKITAYLSTDEIALPYQPDDNFRPSVIFKLAVRSLMTTLRSAVSSLIWAAVYGVIWVPVVVVGIVLYKKMKKK